MDRPLRGRSYNELLSLSPQETDAKRHEGKGAGLGEGGVRASYAAASNCKPDTIRHPHLNPLPEGEERIIGATGRRHPIKEN